MAFELLQPGKILATEALEEIKLLARTDNDKFWIIPITKYKELIDSKIKKMKNIDEGSKNYLLELVNFMENSGNNNQEKLKKLYKNNTIPSSDIIKNFGEVIGPFYALEMLQSKIRHKMNNIIFPERQNYEIFDFFIKDGIHYGFSSKALKGASNPLVPKLFIERLKEVKNEDELKKKYEKEIAILNSLTEGTMFTGPFMAFDYLMKNKIPAEGFDNKIFTTFKGINILQDAKTFDTNKDKFISGLSISKKNLESYVEFLDIVVKTVSKQSQEDVKKFRKVDLYGYKTDNLVYSMLKYISSVKNFEFDKIMGALFPDLFIVKMDLTKEGIPVFNLQTTINGEKIFRKTPTVSIGEDYAFRSKISWNRVRDKLGVQL